MQALLDLIFAVEGSVSEAAKHLGYLIYALSIIFLFGCCWACEASVVNMTFKGCIVYDLEGHLRVKIYFLPKWAIVFTC